MDSWRPPIRFPTITPTGKCFLERAEACRQQSRAAQSKIKDRKRSRHTKQKSKQPWRPSFPLPAPSTAATGNPAYPSTRPKVKPPSPSASTVQICPSVSPPTPPPTLSTAAALTTASPRHPTNAASPPTNSTGGPPSPSPAQTTP